MRQSLTSSRFSPFLRSALQFVISIARAERSRYARDEAPSKQCEIENPLASSMYSPSKRIGMGLFIRTIGIARHPPTLEWPISCTTSNALSSCAKSLYQAKIGGCLPSRRCPRRRQLSTRGHGCGARVLRLRGNNSLMDPPYEMRGWRDLRLILQEGRLGRRLACRALAPCAFARGTYAPVQ